LLNDLESVFDGLAFILMVKNERFHVVIIFEELSVPFCFKDFYLILQFYQFLLKLNDFPLFSLQVLLKRSTFVLLVSGL